MERTSVEPSAIIETFSATLKTLLQGAAPSVSDLRAILQCYLNYSESSREPETRALYRVVRHLLFLLEDGTCLYECCQLAVDGQARRILEVHYVTDIAGILHKVFARISAYPEAPFHGALHEYVNGPSISLHFNPVVVESDPGHTALPISCTALTADEVRQIFIRKQRMFDRIQAKREVQNTDLEFANNVTNKARSLVELFTNGTCSPLRRNCRPTGRITHSYHGPRLQVLPRLIYPRNGQSPLQAITDSLNHIKAMGFSGLLIGPVDKQSVDVYFGETYDGRLIAHANNHGYWCSGELGVDPTLGSEQDYLALMNRAAELDVHVMQDCVLATLGYSPQLDRFSLSDDTEEMAKWCDLLLDGPNLRELENLENMTSVETYVEALHLLHTGTIFELPRPNLHALDTYRAIMARPRLMIEAMKVTSFRIDMAKYLETDLQRKILNDLRTSIQARSEMVTGLQHQGSFLLEYWTTDYRDINIASTALDTQQPNVYFYDFPLAKALQDIFLHGKGYYDVINSLIISRNRWNIDICGLIPVFIDHDFLFRPIYNGSETTSAIVVAGFALSLMLSANGPCVYSGYGDKAAGAPDLNDFFLLDERHSRRAVDRLFSIDDPLSPSSALAIIFNAFHTSGILENWDFSPFTITGDSEVLMIRRSYRDPTTKTLNQVKAIFARANTPEFRSEHNGKLLFRHNHCPYLDIFISCAPI